MSIFFSKPSDEEHKALYGLLPEIQLLYILGIRAHMDYASGIVGVKRKISWQSLREILYVDPHRGIPTDKTGTPTEAKVRRAVKTLIKFGLLKQIPRKNQLIFECVLAKRDSQAQKQVGTLNRLKQTPLTMPNPTPLEKPVTPAIAQLNIAYDLLTRHPQSQVSRQAKTSQADTPPIKDIYINTNVFIHCRFSDFWSVYPRKENKKKAALVWKNKHLDKKADLIITDVTKRKTSHDSWLRGYIPHATTYLNGERWEDEIKEKESSHDENNPNQRLNGISRKPNSITRSVNAYIRKKQGDHP